MRAPTPQREGRKQAASHIDFEKDKFKWRKMYKILQRDRDEVEKKIRTFQAII